MSCVIHDTVTRDSRVTIGGEGLGIRMSIQSLRRRIERLEKLNRMQNETTRIDVSFRTDGLVECDLPDGGTELITEEEYIARGGIIVTWQDRTLTKEDRKRLRGSHE